MSADAFYDRTALIAEITRDEGRRPGIYIDSTGHVSGGVGRNLSANGFRPNEIDLMLNNDCDAAIAALDQHMPWWRHLDPVRARVLINMAFNLGINGLQGFIDFLAKVQAADWAAAAIAMRHSRWHAQVGERALRLEAMMLTGQVAPGNV